MGKLMAKNGYEGGLFGRVWNRLSSIFVTPMTSNQQNRATSSGWGDDIEKSPQLHTAALALAEKLSQSSTPYLLVCDQSQCRCIDALLEQQSPQSPCMYSNTYGITTQGTLLDSPDGLSSTTGNSL